MVQPDIGSSTAIDPAGDLGSINAMAGPTNITEVLDAKIRELEREAQELQGALQRIGVVNMNLNALRQTRALLAETQQTTTPTPNTNGNMPPIPSPIPREMNRSRIIPGSIGALALEVLREAGNPMHVKDLLAQVRAKGRPTLSEATLVSTLSGYANSGKIKRPAPSTYAL
jgi:hypothetical protein